MSIGNVKGYNSAGDLFFAKKSDGTVLAKIKASDTTVELAGYSFGTKLAMSHYIPLGQVHGPTGLVMTATLGAGVFANVISGNIHTIAGELADGNTKTSVGVLQFQLPNNYVAAGLVTVRITTKLKSVTGTGVANNGSDIDLEVYEQSKSAGTIGSDLNGTAAQTYAALDTVYQKDFVIDPTGLVAADLLNLLITGRAIENDAGNGSLQTVIYGVEVLCSEAGATLL